MRTRVWNVFDPSRAREVEMLVDTRAVYTVLPATLLHELGVEPIGSRRFRLADGRIIERPVGIVGIEVRGLKTHTIAVFGGPGTYLLGVVALEELGLEVDPVRGELRPMELLLM